MCALRQITQNNKMLSLKVFLNSLPRCARHVRCMSYSFDTYKAVNEPTLSYGPNSQERKELEDALEKYQSDVTEVPVVVGDTEIRTSEVHYQVMPFDHKKKIAKYYWADEVLIAKAIDESVKARKQWERTPIEKRTDIFMKAADLMSTKYRMDLNATTMLGQGKTIIQAEIDAADELVDFIRFNCQYAKDVLFQPLSPDPNTTVNTVSYRGMEGFWAAVTPFNFTAIGGHLASAPALMGNVCVWKPSDTAMLSNYTVYKIFREAGLPAGVINFIPALGPTFGEVVTKSPHLAGINFTGSVGTFKHLWKSVASNLDRYKTYPRLIGECGGKNFHFIHNSADAESVAIGTIRSAFEYGGQKCSACSRMYVPQSLWPQIKEKMLAIHKEIKVGSPLEKDSFFSAVIDDKAFGRIKSYLNDAKKSNTLSVIAGGSCNDKTGYFVEPTIIETKDPKHRIMQEEIFGPVLTVYPYDDNDWQKTAELVTETSPFGLTGAIFVKDQAVREELCDIFRDAAGNFYINDKSTGSVVAQQPFGGSRLSGTNDKAGGPHYLMKFVSVQSIKETKVPLTQWKYPSMEN